VVPVHGAGIADGRAFLVMRYVAGHDLRALVFAGGALAPDRATRIALHLGDALDAIHRAGYVHRDAKPQNVLLDHAGHVYLTDFGLAKQAIATAGDTRSAQWVGTLDYVAPEQIRGERVDARADVYALGGVLFFLLTGRVPFERESEHAKLWAHLADPPPRPSDVRPELVITGDAHVSSVRDVPPHFRSFDGDPLATEFMGTSISSEGDQPEAPPFAGDPHNPQLLFSSNRRGYVKVLLEPGLWTSEFRAVSTVLAPEATAWTEATFVVENGKPGAQRLDAVAT
jgi:serine/threonine protein kinase